MSKKLINRRKNINILHKTGSSAVSDIVLEMEGNKKKKRKERVFTGYSYFVTQSRRRTAEHGLTLLNVETWCCTCPCGIATHQYIHFFVTSKILQYKTKKEHITDIGWKIKDKKDTCRNEIFFITCFGNWTRSGTLFIKVLHEDNCFLSMPEGLNLNVKSVASKMPLFTDYHFPIMTSN